MEYFFKPRGVAVVGATKKLKGGLSILLNLIKGYKGGIYPVNPQYDEIEGRTCYPDIQSVPDPVDLAIIFVPASTVPRVIEECAARGVLRVMIQSAGFSESGPEGRALQEKVLELAKAAGMRIWGPNCMGIVDARNRNIFSFLPPTIWDEGPRTGDVSLIVQSGMLSGGFLIDTMSHGTMGISKACSVGNKPDINECDVLEYLISDPDTGAVGMYLEAIPDGRRFFDLCRSSEKPVVVLKGGRSARGAAAALSHTASLAGNSAVVRGALAQAGVALAYDFKQMMDLCRALAMTRHLALQGTGRVAVVSYSGGAGIISSDLFEDKGLSVANLLPETEDRLRTIYPEWMPVANPLDLWPSIERHGGPKVFDTAVRAVCADPNVDAIFLHTYAGGQKWGMDIKGLADLCHEAGKPVFMWLIGAMDSARAYHIEAQEAGIPVFREIHRAVECLAAVFERKRARS